MFRLGITEPGDLKTFVPRIPAMFFLSSIIMVLSLFVEAGPANAGWTIYPPLSALPMAQSGSGMGMTLWLVSMAIFIASSYIFTACL